MNTDKPTENEQKKILVVDDEESVLKLLRTFLSRANYRVTICNNGTDALRALSQTQFSLIITDAVMPVMTGFELIKTVRANVTFQDIPILMLTRKNEQSNVKTALEAGVTDYIIKPLDEHLLMDKVELLLKNKNTPNRLRDVAIHGPEMNATANVQIRLISISETGMIVRFPIEIPLKTPFRLDTPIFKDIGINPPFIRITSLELKEVKSENENSVFIDFPYEAIVTFIGVNEADLKKIRAWLTKQEIQRKK